MLKCPHKVFGLYLKFCFFLEYYCSRFFHTMLIQYNGIHLCLSGSFSGLLCLMLWQLLKQSLNLLVQTDHDLYHGAVPPGRKTDLKKVGGSHTLETKVWVLCRSIKCHFHFHSIVSLSEAAWFSVRKRLWFGFKYCTSFQLCGKGTTITANLNA